MICDECQEMYEEVADHAREADVFAKVRRCDDALHCTPRGEQHEATYLVHVELPEHGRIWIGLYTPDRWLNESIEADLLHRGEELKDLLAEELAERDFAGVLPIEHFRDDDKQFVFRSPVHVLQGEKVNAPTVVRRVAQVLLAYEACFGELGDLKPADESL